MIHPQCFTIEWIRRQSEAIGSANPVMLEKAIVALQLLAHLAESGLPIQFKGGASLLLRLSPIRRLSIDVDIVTQAAPEQLHAVLKRVSMVAPLLGYEHDAQRDKNLPPKKHFRVFYQSAVEAKRDHVLLDVLFEPEEAPHCEPVVIVTPFITPEREVRVLALRRCRPLRRRHRLARGGGCVCGSPRAAARLFAKALHALRQIGL